MIRFTEKVNPQNNVNDLDVLSRVKERRQTGGLLESCCSDQVLQRG